MSDILRVNLSFAGYDVISSNNVKQAESVIKTVIPGVIILDWMLPGTSGPSFAKRLRNDKRTHNIPVIMLTAKSLEENKIEGLNAGCDDYVVKPFSPKELIARVQAVLRRRSPELTKDAVSIFGLSLYPATRTVLGNKQEITLGPKEFKLLHYLMTHTERVHTRAHLLDRVWGDHVFVEERTVDVHVRRLRKALTSTGFHKLIQTVRGGGYKFISEKTPQSFP
ncbi:MAG: DNA-binding response regulator [Proteobacteria bacterium]|nr:DNA-binding response regulator [Pseudomonadota bacterium]